MIKLTKTPILSNCQEPNAFFCIILQIINNCSAFGTTYFWVSFSRERKSERIERKFKAQNPNLFWGCDIEVWARCQPERHARGSREWLQWNLERRIVMIRSLHKHTQHKNTVCPSVNFIFIYCMCAIITRSWFETDLNYKPRILRLRKVSCNTNCSAV